MYRITFSKIGKFLIYQVWDKDNLGNQNDKRAVFRLPAKTWINAFIKKNKNLKEKGKELFTPTTIIETADEEQYACVIRKAYFDSNDRVVFTISTKEIQLANNVSKKLINIQPGCYNNMRFDIDEILCACCYEGEMDCGEGQDGIDVLYEYYGINQDPTGVVITSDTNPENCRVCWQLGQFSNMQSAPDAFYYIKPGVKLKFCDKIYDVRNGLKGAYTCSSFGGTTQRLDGSDEDYFQCFNACKR